MKIQPLKIGTKTAKVPVIQGGMGVGISLGNLAGAVAKEGGIGIISAAQPGFREEDFIKDPLKANLRAIKSEYEKARKIASDGIIGFNLMVAMEHYEEYVHAVAEEDFIKDPLKANLRAIKSEYEKARKIASDGIIGFNLMVAMEHYEEYVHAVVEAGADLIVSGAGLPTDLPKYVGESDILLAPIVSTAKSANVILKYWDKKYHRIPDLVVIEGPLAGGHLGFHEEQLETYGIDAGAEDYVKCRTSYEKEIIAIMQVIHTFSEKYGKKIPVAMGGGIHDSESAARAFSLGADAIQVATRFVTTEECDADIRYKEAYLNARKEDIVIVKSPVGMPGRAILNPFMKKVKELGRIAPAHCFQCLKHCNPGTTPYCITQALINAAKGKIDDALLFCGAYAYQATHLETVKEVIDSLIPERV